MEITHFLVHGNDRNVAVAAGAAGAVVAVVAMFLVVGVRLLLLNKQHKR
jgi:hypothetical protein